MCWNPCSYSLNRKVSFDLGCGCGVIQVLLVMLVLGGFLAIVITTRRCQGTDYPVGAVVVKLDGVAHTNFSALYNESLLSSNADAVDNMVFDSADYVIPPQDNGAFFVMTNMVYTHNQSQGVCPEDPDITGALCDDNNPCIQGEHIKHGIKTGRCVPSLMKPNVSVCEVRAWCPVEINKMPVEGKAVLLESRNFKVQLRNNVLFPKFNHRRRNILHDEESEEFLENCTYDAEHPRRKFCPVFDMETIVKNAGEDYADIAVKGGIISIQIKWWCNFDVDHCEYKYLFVRLDDKNFPMAAGLNFRFAYNYVENFTHKRMLIKAHGIRFLVQVTGEGRQFDAAQCFFRVGSLLGYTSTIGAIVTCLVACFCVSGSGKEHAVYTKTELACQETRWFRCCCESGTVSPSGGGDLQTVRVERY